MRTPSNAFPACPKGFVEGFGKPLPFAFARVTAGFFEALFFAGFDFAFLRAMTLSLSKCNRLN
jgi:hypothetical protein